MNHDGAWASPTPSRPWLAGLENENENENHQPKSYRYWYGSVTMSQSSEFTYPITNFTYHIAKLTYLNPYAKVHIPCKRRAASDARC